MIVRPKAAGQTEKDPREPNRGKSRVAPRTLSRQDVGHMYSIFILVTSMAIVISLIVWARLHAFLALLIGAVAVGVLAPTIATADSVTLAATDFGSVVGLIGIIIALASFIGIGLQQSGGAERIGWHADRPVHDELILVRPDIGTVRIHHERQVAEQRDAARVGAVARLLPLRAGEPLQVLIEADPARQLRSCPGECRRVAVPQRPQKRWSQSHSTT